MRPDDHALKSLMMRARVLRRRCVEAHNRLQNDSGRSVLSQVIRCLPVTVGFDGHCAEHRLLSCYAFWGHEAIGGRRSDFTRRLERSAPVPVQLLHRRMDAAVFGAWECVDESSDAQEPGTQEPNQWRSLGLDEVASHQVDLLTNVDGERAYAVAGEVRVGWMLEEGERRALLFSMSLAYEAAVRLRETIDGMGWHAPEAEGEGGFRRAEYERDLLTLAVRPDFEECGLDRYYFLPLNQRRTFPGRFFRSLVNHITGGYERTDPPWHVTLAKATSAASVAQLRASFDEARQRAGRAAGRYRGDRVDPAHLPRLATDEEIFRVLGAGADGAVDLSDFLPIKMHLLEYLDLDEAWFEAANLSLKTPIHQARAHLGEAQNELADKLESAIERHRVRLRWVAVVRHVISDEEPCEVDALFAKAAREIEPDYQELYEAAAEIFGPTILDRPIDQILAKEGRVATRIEAALVEKGGGERPIQVRDLPETEYFLGLVRGIGPKSVTALARGLRDAMLGWPDAFARPSGDSSEEAAEGIESGLDELDALFG